MEKFKFTNEKEKDKTTEPTPKQEHLKNEQIKAKQEQPIRLNNVMRQDVEDMKTYILRLNRENKITIPYALNKAFNDFGYKDPAIRELLKKIILNDFQEAKKIKELQKKELEMREKELKPKKPSQLEIGFPEEKE